MLRPGGRLLATFFLLNEESEAYLAGTAELPHEAADERGRRYRSSRAEVPEHRVAMSEDDVRAMHAAAGLEITRSATGVGPGGRRAACART